MQAKDLLGRAEEPIFALTYGDSGTGKTDFCGTCAELGYTLVIDIDMGFKTLKYSKRIQPLQKNLVVVSFDKFQDLDHAHKLILKNDPVEWTKVLGVEVAKPFEFVVWDSWSELQWNMMQKLRADKSLLGSSLDFRKNLEIQHWGALTDLNKLCIQALREATEATGVSQVFIMLETMTKDEISGAIFGGPAIHGKMVKEMPGYFDVVVRTYTDMSGKYMATTKSKGKWPAKSRIKPGEDYTDPTAKKIFK